MLHPQHTSISALGFLDMAPLIYSLLLLLLHQPGVP